MNLRGDQSLNEGERGGWGEWGGGGGSVWVYSHILQIEVIIEQILTLNFRGDSRINEGVRGGSDESMQKFFYIIFSF